MIWLLYCSGATIHGPARQQVNSACYLTQLTRLWWCHQLEYLQTWQRQQHTDRHRPLGLGKLWLFWTALCVTGSVYSSWGGATEGGWIVSRSSVPEWNVPQEHHQYHQLHARLLVCLQWLTTLFIMCFMLTQFMIKKHRLPDWLTVRLICSVHYKSIGHVNDVMQQQNHENNENDGTAKAGMVHSVSGWTRGETVRSLENACHTWAP